MKKIIIGNGTIADNPKKGSGVQHGFTLFEEVEALNFFKNERGEIYRVECRNKEGLIQFVDPLHIKDNK